MGSKLWFKRKTYGWGWTPASAEGWLVILAFSVLMGVYPMITDMQGSEFSPLIFLVVATLLTAGLIWICLKKGEEPSWKWGDNDKRP